MRQYYESIIHDPNQEDEKVIHLDLYTTMLCPSVWVEKMSIIYLLGNRCISKHLLLTVYHSKTILS